jgi:hypothetical protein
MKNYLKRFFKALFQLFKNRSQVVESIENNVDVVSELSESPVEHHNISTSNDTESI